MNVDLWRVVEEFPEYPVGNNSVIWERKYRKTGHRYIRDTLFKMNCFSNTGGQRHTEQKHFILLLY